VCFLSFSALCLIVASSGGSLVFVFVGVFLFFDEFVCFFLLFFFFWCYFTLCLVLLLIWLLNGALLGQIWF